MTNKEQQNYDGHKSKCSFLLGPGYNGPSDGNVAEAEGDEGGDDHDHATAD